MLYLCLLTDYFVTVPLLSWLISIYKALTGLDFAFSFLESR